MRYQLIDSHHIVPIKVITHNGVRTSNPPDSLADDLALGYPYEPSESPDVGSTDPLAVHSYALQSGVIVDVWSLPQSP